MKKTLVLVWYHDRSMKWVSNMSKEAIVEALDYAEEHSWSYVVLEDSDMIIPMSGLQEVHLYDL